MHPAASPRTFQGPCRASAPRRWEPPGVPGAPGDAALESSRQPDQPVADDAPATPGRDQSAVASGWRIGGRRQHLQGRGHQILRGSHQVPGMGICVPAQPAGNFAGSAGSWTDRPNFSGTQRTGRGCGSFWVARNARRSGHGVWKYGSGRRDFRKFEPRLREHYFRQRLWDALNTAHLKNHGRRYSRRSIEYISKST